MKILFVINPNSGTDSNDKVISMIQEAAALKKMDTKFLYTAGKKDDEAIQKELKQYKPDRVVAGGGDGTIQLVARNLNGTSFTMALLPLGSANGLATALNIPLKNQESVDYVLGDLSTKPLDLLLINNTHICVHLADIGINAMIVKEYEEAEDSGMIGYAKHLIHAIKETPLLHYTIKTENGTFQQEGYMLAFANAHMYGTGIQITEGSVHDGFFEIRNIPKVAWDDAIKAGLTRFNIFVDKNMFDEVIHCREAEIFIDQKIDFQIDGEYIGQVDYVKVKIIPAAINLLVP